MQNLTVVARGGAQVPQTVKQCDLEKLLELRAQIADRKREAEELEQRVRAAIEAGARIEPGVHDAYFRIIERSGYSVEPAVIKQLIVK